MSNAKKDDNSTEPTVANKNLPAQARMVVADARNDITIPFFSNVLRPVDDTLIKRGGGKGLALYDEVERDTEAWSVLQKRKKVLVSREWKVEAGGEDQVDLEARDFVESQLQNIPFDRICEDLLDATLKGFATSEVVWKREDNRIAIKRVLSHDQRRFAFDPEWKPRLLTLQNMNDGMELPIRKFITHRHGVKGNNPYGLGLGTRLFWPVLFKREGVAFWMTFLDKFASPTLLGKTPYGLTPEMERQLLDSLANWTSRAAMTVPVGTEVGFLEAARSGSVTYEEWCRYWDGQMAICVLGETLTTDTQGVGSQALGNVHADMLDMLVDADADLLSTTLRETLLQWLVDYNFPNAKVPHVWRIRAANEQAEAATKSSKAKASKDTDAALRQVVATSARFTNDEDARDYIQTFAPDDLTEEMLNRLTTARFAFSGTDEQALDEVSKKKNLTGLNASFADDTLEQERTIQDAITSQLDKMGDAWDEGHISLFKEIVSNAASLEDAAKSTLALFASLEDAEHANNIALAMSAAAYAGRDAVLAEVVAGQADASFAEAIFADVSAFNKPFKEQIDFFKQKSPRPTAAWTDVLRGDHDRAFVIAGAKNRDMLADFQNSIAKAMEEGTTLETFRKDFDQIVAKYGWTYKGERGWRTKTIFEHNIRTSYMAGRVKQMRDPDVMKARPYWMYKHGMTRKPKVPRDQHLAWDGLVLLGTDIWWSKHTPPNGWGPCSCGVVTLSKRDLARMGKAEPDTAPAILMEPQIDKRTGQLIEVPQGIDQGWDYQAGDLWERGLVPSQMDKLAARSAFSVDEAGSITDLIEGAKPFKAKQLATGKDESFYVDAFMKAFGAAHNDALLFTDKAGGKIVISDELFKQHDGTYKVTKRGREIYTAQLAEAIQDPDEIWIGISEVKVPEHQGGGTELVVDRKYVRVDPKTGFLAIFELLKGQWTAKTAFVPMKKNSVKTDVNQINKRRQGVLVYKRRK